METPYFLISKDKLDDNISAFKESLEELWPNSRLAYSVKTNSLPWLLQYLRQEDIMAEVVSDEEYLLAQQCGFGEENIIFNGPIKGEDIFSHAVQNHSIINLDSKKDLELVKRYPSDKREHIGIRVNLEPCLFDEKDIGYAEDGFRFGFSDHCGDFELAWKTILGIYGKTRIGLHLHCNSVTRSKEVYVAIAKYAVSLIKKYDLDISYIDMGGGYFGGVPGKTTPKEYILAIKEQLIKAVDPERTILILEPGSAIIGSVVDLYTSVLDVKDTSLARIVTTDGSRIHIDPLWIKSGYCYSIKKEQQSLEENRLPKQIICGYTCMDHDRLMIIENKQELRVGDQIIYHRVGAYSMTLGGMFIRYFPDVYVQDEMKTTKVRSRISTQEYYNINS